MSKSYESPEILELGAADALTLGAKGCRDDGCECQEDGVISTSPVDLSPGHGY